MHHLPITLLLASGLAALGAAGNHPAPPDGHGTLIRPAQVLAAPPEGSGGDKPQELHPPKPPRVAPVPPDAKPDPGPDARPDTKPDAKPDAKPNKQVACEVLTAELPRGGRLEVSGENIGSTPLIRIAGRVARTLERRGNTVAVQVHRDSDGGAVTLKAGKHEAQCGTLTIIGKN